MLGAFERRLTYYLKRSAATSLLLLFLASSHAEHPPVDPPEPACVDELTLALSAASALTQQRRDEVEQRRHDLDLARSGLSTLISVQPSYSGERNLSKPERSAEWGPGIQLDANLHYRYDLVEQLRAQVALHKAQQRYRDQRRNDGLAALLTFSSLRVAQRAAASADQAAADAEKVWAAAEAASIGDDSPVVALDLREASLTAQRAVRAATVRHAEVSTHRNDLLGLGIQPRDGCHVPPTLPLLVPVPTVYSNDEHTTLLLALQLAEAQSQRATLAPLRELTVNARYQENGARTTMQVGLASGRPEASLEFRWRDVATHSWTVGVTANLRLDDSMGAAMSTAQAAAISAATALANFEADFAAAIAEADATLAHAYAEVRFAQEAIYIAQERRELAATEREHSRTEQALLRALDAYERAYQSYLRAVTNRLSQFGFDWSELAEP